MTEQAILSYLRGELGRRDIALVEQWCAYNAENQRLLDAICDAEVLRRSVDVMYGCDEEQAYMAFSSDVGQPARTRGNIRRPWRVAIATATAAVALLASGYAGMTMAWRTQNPITVSTSIGERSCVDLPDGTRVWLNACSELKCNFTQGSSQRKVSLRGEAYFEVEKAPDKPFLVECNGMQIKVLGTKFNVMANADDSLLTATLLEGSLQVNSPYLGGDGTMLLRPNEKLTLDPKNGVATLSRPYDISTMATSWIDGQLVFSEATFEQIVHSLERSYNISIHFGDDKIRYKKFTCSFSTYDNIYRIMSILGMTEKFDYAVDGRNIMISSRQHVS